MAKIVVPRQLPEDSSITDMLDIVRPLSQALIIVVYFMTLLFDLKFTNFWIFISSVALVSHLAMGQMIQHAYTELAYDYLMDMIRIDYFGFSGSFDDWLYEKYEFTSTGAFSSAFYTMGYSSRNVISNVGPINFIAVVFLSTLAFL